MYTQCPECGTVFRVTAPVLRAAQGQVRCGVCDANFDALRALTDEVEAGASAAAPPALDAVSTVPAVVVETPAQFPHATRHTASADETRVLAGIVAARADPARAPGAATTDAPPRPVDVNVLEPEDFEHIVLGGEETEDGTQDPAFEFDLPADEWERVFIAPSELPVPAPLDFDLAAHPQDLLLEPDLPDEFLVLEEPPEEHADRLAPTDAAQRADDPSPASEPRATVTIRSEPAAGDDRPSAPHAPRASIAPAGAAATEPAAAADDDFLAFGAGARKKRPAAGRWQVAAATLLAFGLAAQAVHHWREPLSGVGRIGPALAELYARLGAPLEPRWEVAAYEVHQWGAASEEAAGSLRLRASIVNHAAQPQPYPLLRVTLEDRFGGKVARREFAPAEYLPGRAPPRELLAPGARADADLRFADPGSLAVGFELDVCLHRNGGLSCATDAKPPGNS